jgi:hypothetical protein
MSRSSDRSALIEMLNTFIQFWRGDDRNFTLFADSVTRSSSHRGQVNGIHAVTQQMQSDFDGLKVTNLIATNVSARRDAEQMMVSGYLLGSAHKQGEKTQQVDFGGVLTLTIDPKASLPQILEIRLQVIWTDGYSALLRNWKLPTMQRLWRPGDEPSALTSELDAPWHRIPVSNLPCSDQEAIAETWYRYAWGLDLADSALVSSTFSEDVEANLPPMGVMNGKRTVVSIMKAFRAPWPWMQHYGEPLKVNVSSDGATASVVLGRIMSERTATESGQPLYGAHYQIGFIKHATQGWLINYISYLPGWVTYTQQKLRALNH